jgi:hypothetical protein
VNMQTSFMHPPFGFALFYLRSVAPAQVRTSDIYWGAVPFVVIQLMMVAAVIAFPQMVMHYKGGGKPVHPGAFELQVPTPQAPPPADVDSDAAQREIERALKH